MKDIVLSATQVFQLAAVGPSIFLIIYLLFSFRKPALIILPLCYFIALSSTFLLPVLSAFPEFAQAKFIKTAVIFSEDLMPVLSFLLIIQFILGKSPPWPYWLMLSLPLVGGSSLTYLAVTEDDICLQNDLCYSTAYVLGLYRVFGVSLVFMLLIVFMSRTELSIPKKDPGRRHKYWLVMLLIVFNLLVLGIDLGEMGGRITAKDAAFIKTMIGVTFIYLGLASIFWVFSESMGLSTLDAANKREFSERDYNLIKQLESLVAAEKPYRDLGFNRGVLADMLKVSEHYLSWVINKKYNKSFSELMNGYRISDAKQFLKDGKEPITVISFDTGFSSITSFNRVFKETTGMSPTEFRTQYQWVDKQQIAR